jgi:hypothetical protein
MICAYHRRHDRDRCDWPPSGRTSGKISERIDDGAKGEGIEAPLHFDGKLRAQADANTRCGLRQPDRDQFKEATGGGLLLFEPAPPGIEIGWVDLGVPTIGGNTHAACRLILHDGAPMVTPFCSRHILAPNYESILLSGGIAQRMTIEKTGGSDAYPDRRARAPPLFRKSHPPKACMFRPQFNKLRGGLPLRTCICYT